MGAKSSSRGDSSANGQNLKNCRTSHAKTLFLRSRGLFLETKIVAKYGLGALGSTFEPSWGSWRLPEDSWRHLEALLEALGSLLERKKEGEGLRGELEERSGRARGGVGEGFSTLSPWAKGVKGMKGMKGLKG